MKTKQKKAVAVVQGQAPSPRGRVAQRLKPERVQDGLSVRRALQHLKVMQRLDAMPGWKLSADSRAIGKARPFADPKDAAAYAAFAVQLAAGRGHPLGITVSSGRLVVTLRGRTRNGITGTLLDLAAELG